MAESVRPYGGMAGVYDAEYRDFEGDIGFWLERLWRHGVDGTLVELGCGTGRVTLPLAEAGYRILGIDISAAMLRRARVRRKHRSPEVALRATFAQQDIRAFRARETAAGVLAPFGTYSLLVTREDRLACLECCHRQMRAGAPLWLDIASLRAGDLSGTRRATHSFRLPWSGEVVEKTTEQRVEPDSRCGQIRYVYRRLDPSGEREIDSFTVGFDLALLSEADVAAELDEAGFELRDVFGNHRGDPAGPGQPRLIFEAVR